MTKQNKKLSLTQWVHLIQDEEMPIFGHTVQSILNVAEDDDAPSAQLANVVLRDASMTARILKLVNTIHYNPQSQRISTISRAVIVLGFNTVRNMCLTITLVDSLVRNNAREHLTRALARAIHAAVQARTIALARNDDSSEEIFIATLLYHIGEMAFWCFSGDIGDELDSVMRQPGYTPEQAQQEVLGFTFKELSSNLAHEWHLNPLLLQTLNHPRDAGDRGLNITLAHELAESAEQHGWQGRETLDVLQRISKFIAKPVREGTSQSHQAARVASEIAHYYGAANAARAIPLPDGGSVTKDVPLEQQTERFPQPDGMLQLKVLRELAHLLETSSDFNIVIEMVMEGVYRGVGMDRVLFALMTPDKKGIRAKFALGEGNEELAKNFHFARAGQQPQIFFDTIIDGKCLLVDTAKQPELQPMVNSKITSVVGKRPFMTAAIQVNGRGIGLLYADRAHSDRELDEESFESFKHFSKQANMGLSLIAARR